MTIDIRAICKLNYSGNEYEIISGSVSDSYLSGAGLVTTSGSVEINGILNPIQGGSVAIEYTKNGITRKIPRNLRVLSSFADPFRNTTKVSIGCSLTLKAAATAPPGQDDEEKNFVTADQLNCINNYEYPPFSDFPPPIYANDLAKECLAGLDIGGAVELNNTFYIEKFVFESPYVDILSDLLISECFFGYVNSSSALVTSSLRSPSPKSCPVLTADRIIDISEINSGEIGAEAVFVKYTTLVLEPDFEQLPTSTAFNNDYTFNESFGDPVTVNVTGDQGTVLTTGTYVPYSSVTQEYGEDQSWDPRVCVLYSSAGERPDLSDSVVYRLEKTRICLAESNERYAALAAANGQAGSAGIFRTDYRETKTYYTYDNRGNVTLQIKEVYEPYWAVAGKMNFSWYQDGQMIGLVSNPVLVERTETATEYQYPPLPVNPFPPGTNLVEFNKNYTIEKSQEANVVITTTTQYKHPLYYTDFQHSKNLVDTEALGSELTASLALAIAALGLRKVDRTVDVQTGRVKSAAIYRPREKERIIQSSGYRLEESSEVFYVTGSGSSDTFKEYSMPYNDMDYITANGVVVTSKAKTRAARFGRAQNDLAIGHRYGMNIQTVPENLPTEPFGQFAVSISGNSALYAVDGLTWTIDSSGIIASCDALFQGGVGGQFTERFFPVAPGITDIPVSPTPVDNTPSSILGSLNIGATPQIELNNAFPGATNNQAVLDENTNEFWVSDGSGNWSNIGTVLGPSISPPATVPVYNVITNLIFPVKTKNIVTFFNYDLSILSTPSPLVIKTKITVNPAVAIAIGSVTIETFDSDELGNFEIAHDTATASVTSLDPEYVGDPFNEYADYATVSVTGSPFTDPVDLAVSETNAYVVYSFEGANNSTSFVSNDPYNIVATRFGDPAEGALPVISTAQAKFGSGSGCWDGAWNDYVEFSTPNFTLGDLDFTVEFWVYIPDDDPFGDRYADPYIFNRGDNPSFFIEINTAPTVRNVLLVVGEYSGTWVNWTETDVLAWNFNEWTHICITRTENELWLAVNGVFSTQDYSTWGNDGIAPIPYTTYLTGLKHGFGNSTENNYYDLYGYIDEFRLTIGQAVYGTDNFTVPTVAFEEKPQVSLIFLFNEGAGINTVMSESPYVIEPAPVTQGTPILSSAQVLFGDSALYFDNTGVPGQENRILFTNPVHFGTDDYCIELWVYVSSDAISEYDTLIDFGHGFSIDINVDPSSYAPHAFICYHYVSQTSGNETYEGPGDNDTFGDFDEWVHIAAFRLDGNHYIAINGVVDSSYTHEELIDVYDFDTDPLGRTCGLGTWPAETNNNGNCNLSKVYIDSLKITAGSAVYSADGFDPPTGEFSTGVAPGNVKVKIPQANATVTAYAPGGTVFGGYLVNYPDFTSTTGLGLVSVASTTGGVIYLTDTTSNDVGNIWTSATNQFSQNFSAQWTFECSGGSGADGFTVQWYTANNVNGGYGGTKGRVENSNVIHAISFATFTFGGPNTVTWYNNNSQQSVVNSTLSSPGWRQNVNYWMDYDHSLQQLSLYYSTGSTKPTTASHVFSAFVFTSTSYYMGFGAACGGLTDNHIIKKWIVES
jgi:hypothetical protein